MMPTTIFAENVSVDDRWSLFWSAHLRSRSKRNRLSKAQSTKNHPHIHNTNPKY